jgi:triosephosphate isomerase
MNDGRVPVMAGNWKMYKTPSEGVAFIGELVARLGAVRGREVVVGPPFTGLADAVRACAGSDVTVAAQDVFWQNEGAFTGEVAPTMLVDLGVRWAIVGHSERRQLFGETDKALQLKLPAALEAGLRPILCVGETEEERERGDTERKLRHQVQEAVARLDPARLGEVVIAYEPIWAIGTGRVATPEQAQEAIAFVRALVADRSPGQAQLTRILYGGSVKAENAAELMALPDIDGALVGGASLNAESLAEIVAAAA